MGDEKLSKEAVVSLLSRKLNCSEESLVFLFSLNKQSGNSHETLEIPEQRITK